MECWILRKINESKNEFAELGKETNLFLLHLGKSEEVEIIRIFRKQIKNIFELTRDTNILFLVIYCIMIAYYTKI